MSHADPPCDSQDGGLSRGHASAQSFEAIRHWFEGELGISLLEAERDLVEDLMPGLFGYHLLQVGVFEDQLLCERSAVGHRFTLLPRMQLGMSEAAVVGSFEALPFGSDCIDAVVLHHALDFAQSPHQLLREAARVLRPGGRLLIISFNPISFWGLFRCWRRRSHQPPWRAHFIAQRRLHDWLTLLGLGSEKVCSGFYRPPVASHRWMRRLGCLERWGRRYFPCNGAFLVTLATKEALAGTRSGMSWRHRLTIPLVRPAISRAGKEAARSRQPAQQDPSRPKS